jgi:Ca-activated chloride channel family protein
MSLALGAVLIAAAAAVGYGVVVAIDAADARRRRRMLRGVRRGSQWRRRLPAALVAGAVASLAVAFTQFQLNRQVTDGTVVLAIDVSRSMAATDVQPNRLTAAESAAKGFLDRLPSGFRVGLVSFSNATSVLVAPTIDRSIVQRALASLAMPASNGTVIGDGLSAALDAITADRQSGATRPAAIVLLSDGQDSGSTIPPDQAAERAKRLGIHVYTVAIGQPSTGDASANLLGQIAAQTGAKTYTTSTAGELTRVYDTLGSRISYELAIGSYAGAFVIAALLMTLVAAGVVLFRPRDPYAPGA